MTGSQRAELRNFTRRTASIPRKLARRGAFHLLPLYYFLRLSDLAREGIENSGSFRFADHLYAGKPSGRTALGRWIDARLMAMPAARAFRRRCTAAQESTRAAIEALPGEMTPVRILAVPCGIPRDMLELARALREKNPAVLRRLEYHGMDLDPQALILAEAMLRDAGIPSAHYHRANALRAADYPPCRFHVAISTGLGEFLDDDELASFYGFVYDALESGGTFYTSATARDRRSEILLRLAELTVYYRDAAAIERVLRHRPWRRLSLTQDSTGLQTLVVAVK